MVFTNFDKYFSNFPSKDKQDDFDIFWEKSLSELKKIPIEPVFKKIKGKSSGKFDIYNVSFSGFMKTQIVGKLFIPKNRDKPRVIIHIHDYNLKAIYSHQLLDNKSAYFFLTLRGHDTIVVNEEIEDTTPGFMIEHILDKETYYVKAVYLDVYRAIDVLRLNPHLNCNPIGIMGKGLGAAAALFSATFSKRISALVLDTPSFCQLPLSQNISTSDATNEINTFIPSRRNKKKLIKQNLSYFDAINFSDRIKCPVLTTVGFKDTISPPECIFGLFNHLLCKKTIEGYPDDGNSAGGDKQFIKSIKWLMNIINAGN